MVTTRPEEDASRALVVGLVHHGMDAREFTHHGRRYVRVAPPGIPLAGIDVLCTPAGYVSQFGNGLGDMRSLDRVIWHLMFLFGRRPRARR